MTYPPIDHLLAHMRELAVQLHAASNREDDRYDPAWVFALVAELVASRDAILALDAARMGRGESAQ